MTEEMKKKLQTTQRRTMRMIIQTQRKTKTKSPAATHATDVDEVAEDEPHNPDCEQEEDTTEARPQDTNKQEENNQDADSNPSFDSVPRDELEDELKLWVDYMLRATHKAG